PAPTIAPASRNASSLASVAMTSIASGTVSVISTSRTPPSATARAARSASSGGDVRMTATSRSSPKILSRSRRVTRGRCAMAIDRMLPRVRGHEPFGVIDHAGRHLARERSPHRLLLIRARGEDDDASRLAQRAERKADALRWWLRRVAHADDVPGRAERRIVREQRRGVPVGADPEKDEIAGCHGDERLIRRRGRLRAQLAWDPVDRRGTRTGQERLARDLEVGLWIEGREATLV